MKYLTWIELSKSAFEFNMANFRKLAGDLKIMAVVKSNAYGHGLYEIAFLAQETGGADMLGVYSLSEANFLSSKGISLPILIMGYILTEDFVEAAHKNFSVCISSFDQLKAVAEKIGGRSLKIHLKFDSGLRRLGFYPEEIPYLLEFLNERKNFHVEGLFSHFADIEDTVTHDFARTQRTTFESMSSSFMQLYTPLRHMACSAAGILFKDTYFDMLRVGISMYGLWPSKETLITSLKSHSALTELKPVMSWKTRVAQIKDVRPGDTVGYSRSYRVTRNGKIAIIPVGYYDGYDRLYSNRAKVVINGCEAPIIGKICMNMSMVVVSHIDDLKRDDEVILIGGCGGSQVTADFLAEISGTINYEVVTRINSSIPRIITD